MISEPIAIGRTSAAEGKENIRPKTFPLLPDSKCYSCKPASAGVLLFPQHHKKQNGHRSHFAKGSNTL